MTAKTGCSSIHQALQSGKQLVDEKGIRNVDRVKAELITILRSGTFIRINYAEVVDREDMKVEKEIELGRSMSSLLSG